MRALGIDTSSGAPAVALVDAAGLVQHRASALANQSAERLLPLVREALETAGWAPDSLTRLGVATGPGSFTGLRIGLALAQGLSLGLGVPLVGVGSPRALAEADRSAPDAAEPEATRVVVLDARRGEVFVAAYRGEDELLAPCALAIAEARAHVERSLGAALRWIGSGVPLLEGRGPGAPDDASVAVAALALRLDPATHPPLPLYIRDAGATLPSLPPTPLR